MTSKERAEELVGKFINAKFNCRGCDMPYCDIPCTNLNLSESKECALIAVDEILNISYFTYEPSEEDELYMNYWKQVKQEIQKI